MPSVPLQFLSDLAAVSQTPPTVHKLRVTGLMGDTVSSWVPKIQHFPEVVTETVGLFFPEKPAIA